MFSRDTGARAVGAGKIGNMKGQTCEDRTVALFERLIQLNGLKGFVVRHDKTLRTSTGAFQQCDLVIYFKGTPVLLVEVKSGNKPNVVDVIKQLRTYRVVADAFGHNIPVLLFLKPCAEMSVGRKILTNFEDLPALRRPVIASSAEGIARVLRGLKRAAINGTSSASAVVDATENLRDVLARIRTTC